LTPTGTKSRSTILVVDDTEDVLRVVTTILKASRFRVLSAFNGSNALQVSSDYPDKIDLLLSDIEMPGMTGPELGIDLKKSRPNMQVLFMSALSGDDPLLLDNGWAFIQKPFIVKKLVAMVSAVLDNPDRSPHSYVTTRENSKSIPATHREYP
jgi:two-component system, cell cycle sensor histidine kinase and response regulator CckA